MSGEGFLEVMNGGTAQAPLFLRNFTISMDVSGFSTRDIFGNGYDSEKVSDSIAAFQRMTGQDAVVGCIHSPAFIAEQFGGVMKYPENGIPSVAVHPFADPSSLDMEDVPLRGRILEAVRSYGLTRRKVPDAAVVANVTGPLTKAGVLMGMDVLALAVYSDSDYVSEVIRRGNAVTESYLSEIFGNDSADTVFVASAADNIDLFGTDVIDRFTFPTLKKTCDFVHRNGRKTIFHPHGDCIRGDIVSKSVRAGADCFQFAEENDPAEICRQASGKCAVMGGTDIVPTLLSGSDGDIRQSVERYMDVCGNGRFIFSCSCSLQTGTPMDSIMSMVRAYRSML